LASSRNPQVDVVIPVHHYFLYRIISAKYCKFPLFLINSVTEIRREAEGGRREAEGGRREAEGRSDVGLDFEA
jgi:hypothetical protein